MLTILLSLFAAVAVKSASAATVFAHFMVQNAYAYDVDQWKTDMSAAQDIGIDGFSLNWIPPDCQSGLDWTVARIDDAYTAAQEVGFKLMYSFDMSYSQCNTFWNQTFMQTMISKYAGSSATYRWNSNILVSTFGGDQVAAYGNDFFQTLKNNMKSTNAITLAPALTKYSMNAQTDANGAASQLMSDFTSIDGYLNWQAWPLNVQANMTDQADQAFKSALENAGKTGPYIMGTYCPSIHKFNQLTSDVAVSPWQYKDLNDHNPLDTWVAYSDTLFADRFQQITGEGSFEPDIIELLTWNDFCESHYLRDLPSQNQNAKDFVEMGDMGAYVWGQSHAAWRVIAKYYINWWKTGTPPAITQDQVVYWYRIHPKSAACSAGTANPVRNALYPSDAVFAWALVKDSATISMSAGSNQYWLFEADSSGPATGFVPFPLNELSGNGVVPEVAIMRDGEMIHWANGSQPIANSCDYQNFNPVVNLCGDAMS